MFPQLATVTEIQDYYKPKTIEEYKAAFRDNLERKRLAGTIIREQPQTTPLRAGFDCGRWVVNCDCGSGIALHPAWQYAACFLCGRTWTKIIFPTPEEMAAIDAVLSLRPPGPIRHNPLRWYSWWPEETIEDLVQQNIRYGWPIPEGHR